ncbi:MAG: biotin/lipoyl-containing protein, partial [Acidobacteriota bacterium]
MRVDVIMPQMGESIAEGTLTRWLKKPGDKVARDEPIFEISTDKVDAEIPSPAAGTLAEIRVQEGQTVPINVVVAQIETEAGQAATAGKAATPAAAAKQAPPRPGGPADGRDRAPSPAGPPVPVAGGPFVSGASDFREVPKAALLIGSGATVEDLRRVLAVPTADRV